MGNYLFMVKPNINLHEYNKFNKFNDLNKYNEPLKYNVNIIKPFIPKLKTIYE
jgi:hypothetical protein